MLLLIKYTLLYGIVLMLVALGGMLFHNEVFQPLEAGMHLSAFVKQVRPDWPQESVYALFSALVLHPLPHHPSQFVWPHVP